MLAVHDGLPRKIADLKQEEAHLVVADPAAERQNLIRQIAKLQNLTFSSRQPAPANE